MNWDSKNRIDRWIGPVLGGIALVVYGLTLSSGAYPGESARLIVQYTGLFPRLTPDHPIWSGLAWVISKIPVGGLALRLNIFSVLCSAASIWLIYEIMAAVVHSTIHVDESNRLRAGIAARLAGIASALFLAFCIPFWIVSNRAHTASFDILLLLIVTWLFFLWSRTGSTRFILLFAFLYGLGIVEFATFILFAPLFGFYLLYFLWRRMLQRGELEIRLLVLIVLSAVAGLLLYLIAAWSFYGTAGYELRGYTNFFKIIWIMWRDQYWLITRSLPRVGWLIILFMSVIPWLACLLVGGRALNGEKDWTYYVLHIVMSAIAGGVLLNMKFAPWTILGLSRLLVTPYVLAASVFGYLIAYWLLLPGAWWADSERVIKLWIRKWLGPVIIVPGLGLLCIAPFRNLGQANGRPAGFINRYAQEIVKSISGYSGSSAEESGLKATSTGSRRRQGYGGQAGQADRLWLITDGAIDNHLFIAAGDLGCPLRVLNLRAGNNEAYMKYAATLFEKPRFKNLAEIGMLPLLQEWFETDVGKEEKVGVMWPSDLWISAGLTIVPYNLVFFGTKEPETLDPAKLMAEHERFWAKMAPIMQEAREETGFLVDFGRYLLRHTGLVANNLGVLLEDLGQGSGVDDLAFRAYSKAREIDPENVSALLNLNVMVEKGYETKQAQAIKKDMETLAAKLKSKYHIWSLSRYYGYVRMPQAFAQLGWIWALSGQPGMATSGMKKALALLPDGERGNVKQALADIYLLYREEEKSEALYQELLAKNPENRGAILGLARIASRKGDFGQAKDLLERAEQAGGVAKTRMALEWASLHAVAGNIGQSRIILEELIELKPDLLRAWAMLVGVLIQQKDQTGLTECIQRMERLKVGQGHIIGVARSHLALFQNDWEGARKHLEEALALNPGSVQVLELLLKLDVFQIDEDSARAHIMKLLKIDSGNALGNYILGSLQLKSGEYTLAEDSFRKSLEKKKSPNVLNDLAWLLQQQGSYAEAEELVRAALEMNDRMYNAWDTLAVILMRTERLDEAEKALKRSISIFRDDFSVFVHMAELQAMQGNKKRVLELLEMLSDKLNRLSFADQKKLAEVRDMVGSR